MSDSYDYVIVGAGSAGCVLATGSPRTPGAGVCSWRPVRPGRRPGGDPDGRPRARARSGRARTPATDWERCRRSTRRRPADLPVRRPHTGRRVRHQRHGLRARQPGRLRRLARPVRLRRAKMRRPAAVLPARRGDHGAGGPLRVDDPASCTHSRVRGWTRRRPGLPSNDDFSGGEQDSAGRCSSRRAAAGGGRPPTATCGRPLPAPLDVGRGSASAGSSSSAGGRWASSTRDGGRARPAPGRSSWRRRHQQPADPAALRRRAGRPSGAPRHRVVADSPRIGRACRTTRGSSSSGARRPPPTCRRRRRRRTSRGGSATSAGR